MSKKDNGGFVYPPTAFKKIQDGLSIMKCIEGITRRDWLAGLAMSGMIGEYILERKPNEDKDETEQDILVSRAYSVADAMIAEGRKAGE